MDDQNFEISLGNVAGVPILRLGGSLSKRALHAIKFTLDRLAKAGHYHVVLNIERAQASRLELLGTLSDSIANIKKHYGAVDLVATRDRAQHILRTERLAELFRLSESESQAIRRIKRLARVAGKTQETSARLWEKL